MPKTMQTSHSNHTIQLLILHTPTCLLHMSGVQTSFRAGRWLGAAWQQTLPGSDVLNWEVDAASR